MSYYYFNYRPERAPHVVGFSVTLCSPLGRTAEQAELLASGPAGDAWISSLTGTLQGVAFVFVFPACGGQHNAGFNRSLRIFITLYSEFQSNPIYQPGVKLLKTRVIFKPSLSSFIVFLLVLFSEGLASTSMK